MPANDASLVDVLRRGRVVVCCGTGGVGKTTTAAALALEAARLGRRAAVVTIDPARRLADALGVGELSNDPQRVPADVLGDAVEGELWALMLDTRTTFDALVTRYAGDARQAERILANPFYRNISGRLSGTQEYMAAEKLFELAHDERFDLVVVDTPPARNALDFLDAPERLTRFLDHRFYRALMAPTRVYLRAVNVAAQAFLRAVSRVVGGAVIADAVAFFQAFDGMEAGFRTRAAAVDALLRSPDTTYVLVAAPRTDAVAEASWFADRLADLGLAVGALVVNRAHPAFGGVATPPGPGGDGTLAAWWRNLAELQTVAAAERVHVATLAAHLAPAPTVIVPLQSSDVHDLAGLRVLTASLVGDPLRPEPPATGDPATGSPAAGGPAAGGPPARATKAARGSSSGRRRR